MWGGDHWEVQGVWEDEDFPQAEIMLLDHAEISYCNAVVLREEMHCPSKPVATGFLWVLGLFIYLFSENVNLEIKKLSWQSDVWLRILGAGFLGPAPAPGRVYPFERHHVACAEHWEKQAGSTGWEAVWEGGHTPWFMLFPLESCVLGRSLSWGWRSWSGRLAGASELPNYLVVFLSWRTKSKC